MTDPRVRARRADPKVGRWLIYGIIDPGDRTLIYVGKTHKRRELRLAEHLADASAGQARPLHRRLAAMLADGVMPEIVVLERVRPNECWKDAERRQIATWREWPGEALPVLLPPQTRRSTLTVIAGVDLQNVRPGG